MSTEIRKQEVIFTYERVARLLSMQDRANLRRFVQAVAATRNEWTVDRLVDLIRTGRIQEFIDEADRLINSNVSAGVVGSYALAGNNLSRFFARELQTIINFDQFNTRALRNLRQIRLDFETAQGRISRNTVRRTLFEGLRDGINPVQTAQRLRDTIGLNQRQRDQLERYRRLLTSGPGGLPSTDALSRGRRRLRADQVASPDPGNFARPVPTHQPGSPHFRYDLRDTRDVRFNMEIRNAINTNTRLTPTQIDALVERYRRNLVRYRAQMVSRTETLRSMNLGYEESILQAIDSGHIQENQIWREWVSVGDHRVRSSHRRLGGMRRRVGQDFIRGQLAFPGDPRAPGSETINCRCILVVVFDADLNG